MQVTSTSIPDVRMIEPKMFGDARGFLVRLFCADELRDAGWRAAVAQVNQTRTRERGSVRGMHYQRPPHAEMKLVQCLRGEVFDVAVDLRRSSATFGRHVAVTLSAENRRMLFIPPGFAHGFLVVSDNADFLYKTTDYWYPQHERTLLWNDAALGIDWPRDIVPTLAAKDAAGVALAAAEWYR